MITLKELDELDDTMGYDDGRNQYRAALNDILTVISDIGFEVEGYRTVINPYQLRSMIKGED